MVIISISTVQLLLNMISDLSDSANISIKVNNNGAGQQLLMNSLCFVCEDPCTRVCTHPKCTSPPFFCSGPCNKGTSLKMHTHDGTQKYITYNQLQSKLGDFQNIQNPQLLHKKHFDEIQKKFNITKTHIEDQLKQINILIKQHKQELYKISNFQICQSTLDTIEKISQDKTGKSLTGQRIKNIFKMYNNILEYQSFNKVKTLQSGFLGGFETLCQLKFSSMFLSLEKITQSRQLHDEGEQLFNDKQTKKALEKFLLATELNRYDYEIYFQLGRCYSLLGDLDKCRKSFERSLFLNPKESNTYANIGRIHYKKGNYQQAMKWCDKSIVIGNETANVWAFKGTLFIELKKYPEAIKCYEKAVGISPENEQLQQKLEELRSRMESKNNREK